MMVQCSFFSSLTNSGDVEEPCYTTIYDSGIWERTGKLVSCWQIKYISHRNRLFRFNQVDNFEYFSYGAPKDTNHTIWGKCQKLGKIGSPSQIRTIS